MKGRTPQISAEQWIDIAKQTLIAEGIVGVKVDRLAHSLGVTRGGFYHNFTDREDMLNRLLDCWERTCRFLPEPLSLGTPADAIEWMDDAIQRLIDENGYDHHFDMAVREWARSDRRVNWAVARADRDRVATMQKFFEIFGYDSEESKIRARVFYYHQIGYYAIGVRQSPAERRRNAKRYMDILFGAEKVAAARTAALARPGNRKAARA